MAPPHSLYNNLWQEFQSLSYDEKKDKLINILHELGNDLEDYQETLELVQNSEAGSEEYFDALYEAIIGTLAEDFEQQRAKNFETVKSKFQKIQEDYEIQREKEIAEADMLLNVFIL